MPQDSTVSFSFSWDRKPKSNKNILTLNLRVAQRDQCTLALRLGSAITYIYNIHAHIIHLADEYEFVFAFRHPQREDFKYGVEPKWRLVEEHFAHRFGVMSFKYTHSFLKCREACPCVRVCVCMYVFMRVCMCISCVWLMIYVNVFHTSYTQSFMKFREACP